jgi:DNA polymerase-3 subunit delta'
VPLSSIVGHQYLIRLLGSAVTTQRVPQSLLFAGPDGVGKRTAAIALAQAINCPRSKRTGPLTDACGSCPTCRRIAAGQHSDVVLIDKGGEASIRIRALRERLLEVVGYRPFEARRRVFVIDPADELTLEAQDALLKTLEEPPSSAILILVTAYPDTLLPTIQSRCRRLRFAPLADADVAHVLETQCGVDAKKARLMAAGSFGSVERALAEESGDLSDDRDAALALLTAAARSGVGPRLKAAAALAQHGSRRRDREALGARLALLSSLCRDLAALRAGAGGAIANVDLAEELAALEPAFEIGRLAAAYGAIAAAQQALDRNASPKIVADWIGVEI